MIAAIYARRSDDQNDRSEDAKSITRQVERARAYAEKHGWTFTDSNLFVDDNIRGSEFVKRQGYMRLLNSLKPRPPFDILIVSELSRLGREQFETGYAVKQLSQAGVRIDSYLEGKEIQLNSPTDKFLIAAANFASEMEREKARQRVTDTMTRKAARGHACGGDCYGYRNVEIKNADGRRSHVGRVIEEAEAEVVRRIFDMCAAGYGVKRIAKQLNAEHRPSPRARQGRPGTWAASAVRPILFRELYRGINIWNKRRQTDSWGLRRTQRRPETEWIRAEVPHLRIITDEEWTAAHNRLARARQAYLKWSGGRPWGRPAAGVQSKYLLSGFLRCARCGASMTVRTGTHGLGQRAFYICGSYDSRGRSVCSNSLRLPMESADDAILSQLSGCVLDPTIVEGAIADALAELQPSHDAHNTRRAALIGEIRKLEDEQARFVSAIAVAGNVEALARALADREQQRQSRREELALLDHYSATANTFDLKRMEAVLREQLREWREALRLQTSEARKVISELLDGKIGCTPHPSERKYSFAGRVKVEQLLVGDADLRKVWYAFGAIFGTGLFRSCGPLTLCDQ